MNKLYLMFGYPGAGKTTTANVVAELTGATLLSSDQLRLKMFPKPSFNKAEHQQLYAELDARTEKLLSEGKSVIYDANLNRYQHRQDKYEICRRTGAKPVLLWVQTPRDVAKERASHFSRQHLWPNGETANQLFNRIAALIEEPRQDEKFLTVDGTKVTPAYIRQVLQEADALWAVA